MDFRTLFINLATSSNYALLFENNLIKNLQLSRKYSCVKRTNNNTKAIFKIILINSNK